jgi:hypothetical protein
MSSLRALLDVADTNSIPIATYYGPQNSHQIWFRGSHCWSYSDTHNYFWQEFAWCVPTTCVCKVEFEIWGGGGGGSGSCCCMNGWNGHAGQYNKCTVCAATQGISQLDECCYCICVASITCRAPGNGGYDGCKSYILGPGLDNFCACGGCYGRSCCFGAASYSGGCQFRNNWMVGAPHCRWQTDKYDSPRTTRDLCCQYGKEYWGTVDSYNQNDCTDCGNWCNQKIIVPTAPYQDGKFGTFHNLRNYTMATCQRDSTLWMTGNNGGLSSDCFRNGPPGMGGFSSNTYGGGCCCGSEGAAGLAKITIYCKV